MKTKESICCYSLLIAGVFLMLTSSCSKSDSAPSTDQKVSYLAAGCYGDLIVFQLDKITNQLSYTNESTNIIGSATLALTTNPNLTRIYQTTQNANTYYAMELSEKMFVTTFPAGNAQNKFCFGVYTGQNYDNFTMTDLAGKYLFTVYDDNNTQVVYGGYNLDATGILNWSYGPSDPSLFNESVHFFGNNSTWSKSTLHSERIISSFNGTNYEGIIYPGKIMLIDNGVGNGFTLGIKYPAAQLTQSSVAGKYEFIDITKHNETGIGYYIIPTSGGNVSFYHKYSGLTGEGTGTLTGFASIPQIKAYY